MNRKRVLLADDHAIVRFGLNMLFKSQPDFIVVGQAQNGKEAVAAARETHPDIVVMDLSMPVMDGVEATQAICREMPDVKVLILTSFGNSDGIAHALEAGAMGAIMKTTEDENLVPVVRRILGGERVVSPEIQTQLDENPPVPALSQRQKEILESMMRGLTNRDISYQFGISEKRVEQLIKALITKINAANRTEAVAIALRRHLLKA